MKFFFIAKLFLLFAFVIVLLSGLTYVTSQQILRQGANDPQIQMAEDVSSRLDHGDSPQTFLSSNKIDIAKSLSPFVIVYDTKGNAVFSSGELQGDTPVLPRGVLDAANSGEQRVTWQPQRSVRIASVVTSYKNGYVLAGRSLREVEKREDALFMQVGVVSVCSLVGSFLIISLFAWFYPYKKR